MKQALTTKFVAALGEIFEYFDRDKDGVLSDVEMQHMSNVVWNEEMKNETLLHIKDTIFQEEYVVSSTEPKL